MKAKLKKIAKSLLAAASAKASAEGNSYVLTLLKGIDLKNLAPADFDMMTTFLGLPDVDTGG